MQTEQVETLDLGTVLAAVFAAEPAYSRADIERSAAHYFFARVAEFYGLGWDEVTNIDVPIPDSALEHLFTPHGWQILGLMYAAHYGRGAAMLPVSIH